MKTSIYEYDDYKEAVVDLIESSPQGERGQRKRLSDSLGCQLSHVSNVLSGEGHFSPEQSEGVARFFALDENETDFFLMLVQMNRAGTKTLEDFYRKQLKKKKEQFTTLKKRLELPDELRERHELKYYSSWQFCAVHVLLSISEYQTRESISEKLNLPMERVTEILSFLIEAQLVEKKGNSFHQTKSTLHLDKSSPMIGKHHGNWRLRTLGEFDSIQKESVHYSGTFTLSTKDYEKVAEILKKALKNSIDVVIESKEEEFAVFCMNFYRI